MTSIADRVADQTLPRAFLATVAERGDTIALRWKDGDDWGQMSYEDYRERVARAAAGLRALGVGHGDRVVLMLRNSPEFHILESDVGKDPDQRNYIVSNEKLEKTGYQPQVSLQKGIAELIRGYQVVKRNQYSNV